MILNCLLRYLLPQLLLLTHYATGQLGCPDRNGKWPDPVQCDAYLECKDGIGERKLCSDGLVFAPERYYGHPCVYPQETDCTNRPNRQTPQPTGECPHQFGMYGFGDPTSCGRFMVCSNGQAYIKDCPEGLAYNEQSLRCDWPDQVPSCNVEGYLSFSCPTNPYGESGGYDFYRSPASCDRYFICIAGKPRLLVCSSGLLFDIDTNMCLPAQNVTSCYSSTSRSNQQGFQSNDQGYQSNQQGGFQSNQQGFQSNQQGFQSNQQGFQSNQQGFQSNDQGFQSNQQGFQSNDQGFQSNPYNPNAYSNNDYFS